MFLTWFWDLIKLLAVIAINVAFLQVYIGGYDDWELLWSRWLRRLENQCGLRLVGIANQSSEKDLQTWSRVAQHGYFSNDHWTNSNRREAQFTRIAPDWLTLRTVPSVFRNPRLRMPYAHACLYSIVFAEVGLSNVKQRPVGWESKSRPFRTLTTADNSGLVDPHSPVQNALVQRPKTQVAHACHNNTVCGGVPELRASVYRSRPLPAMPTWNNKSLQWLL